MYCLFIIIIFLVNSFYLSTAVEKNSCCCCCFLPQSKLPENHILHHSGTYLGSPYMAVPPRGLFAVYWVEPGKFPSRFSIFFRMASFWNHSLYFWNYEHKPQRTAKDRKRVYPERRILIKTWSAKITSRHIKFCKQNTAMLIVLRKN